MSHRKLVRAVATGKSHTVDAHGKCVARQQGRGGGGMTGMISSSWCRRQVLSLLLALLLLFGLVSALVEDPPAESLDAFTMGGSVPLERFIVDDTDEGRGSHYKYPRGQVDKMVSQAKQQLLSIGVGFEAQRKQLGQHLSKRQQIYAALFKHQDLVRGRKVVVIGSMEPWVEAALLALEASHVTTVEYNQLTYNHPQLTTLSAPYITDAIHGLYSPESEYLHSFDLALSISAFDHDGLGRYNDPINPTGDIDAMAAVKRLLKKGTGRLLLTVPLGPDVLVWNLHRRYGVQRLPLLLSGWVVQDTVAGLDDWLRESSDGDDDGDRSGSIEAHKRVVEEVASVNALLTTPANWRQTVEPVFLLRPAEGDTSTSGPGRDEL